MAGERPGANTTALGRGAEQKARRHLEAKGLRVIESNKRTKGGELDLVAWDGEMLVFVEVRARKSARFGRPEETVDRRKQERLIQAAGAYLAEMTAPLPACRFDVVSVDLGAGDENVHHIADAFRPGD